MAAVARGEWRRADAVWMAALAALVCPCFAWVHDRLDLASWAVPISYRADALSPLSFAKLVAQGEFVPFGAKTASALNAPAVAHWLDYPSSEEIVFAPCPP